MPNELDFRTFNGMQRIGNRMGRVRRYGELGLIATRVRGWRQRDAALGRSLRQALEQAGGIYVKLGQFLSTRPDLVTPAVADELQLLRDDLAPVSGDDVRRVFVEEFQRHPSELFSRFDYTPVGAASVAQVHRAQLWDGKDVAVKVQRPDVADRVRRDLDILSHVAALLERRTRWGSDQRLSSTVDGFSDSVAAELDFETEARNLDAIRDAVRRHERFKVPQAYRTLTRKRLLVMEWIDGMPLTEGAAALDPDERRQLALDLLHCFLDQIFAAGVFHADPHPGNVHLTPDGRIALLDAGAIGRLDRRQREGLQQLFLAIAIRDPKQMADGLLQVTTADGTVDRERLAESLSTVLESHFGPDAQPGLEMFVAFTDVTRLFGLALEPVVLGAIRALATIHSTIEELSPDLNLLAESSAYAVTQLAA